MTAAFVDTNVIVYAFTTDFRAAEAREIHPIDFEMHAIALKISERHGYAIFDSLMIAAALRSDCQIFWSEDMQDGFFIDSHLQITNPFK